MRYRAPSSGIALSSADAAVVKGMLARGDRQHDIAAWFGVNGGRIAEISSGKAFGYVAPAKASDLPPPGPYLTGREAAILMSAISQARTALIGAEDYIKSNIARGRH